jgi:phospholipid/cholesterol/gamma-HCH transport system permease protein
LLTSAAGARTHTSFKAGVDPARYELRQSGEYLCLALGGDWTVFGLRNLTAKMMRSLADGPPPTALDVQGLGRVDSAGALLLVQALGSTSPLETSDRQDLRRLADLVSATVESSQAAETAAFGISAFFARIGRQVERAIDQIWALMGFQGRLVAALGRTVRSPGRLRLTSLFSVMEQAGINAIPIVMMMCFFIGAIVALVGANLLSTFGVSAFTVELVGVAILREFGAVIAAILFAGRSASAFAAEIGAMRMNQEVDAMKVMGVDEFDALIVPRVLAALLMVPILTFCGDIGGILGGLLVSWNTMDISPAFFLERTVDTVSLTHFWIGLFKAPFFALVIAAAGCGQGLAVEGDTGSLGRGVTSAVVQSIFLIIMFDAIFAVIFMELDL